MTDIFKVVPDKDQAAVICHIIFGIDILVEGNELPIFKFFKDLCRMTTPSICHINIGTTRLNVQPFNTLFKQYWYMIFVHVINVLDIKNYPSDRQATPYIIWHSLHH